jgi:hypothetical protein
LENRGKDGWRKKKEEREKERRENKRKNQLPNFQFKL